MWERDLRAVTEHWVRCVRGVDGVVGVCSAGAQIAALTALTAGVVLAAPVRRCGGVGRVGSDAGLLALLALLLPLLGLQRHLLREELPVHWRCGLDHTVRPLAAARHGIDRSKHRGPDRRGGILVPVRAYRDAAPPLRRAVALCHLAGAVVLESEHVIQRAVGDGSGRLADRAVELGGRADPDIPGGYGVLV